MRGLGDLDAVRVARGRAEGRREAPRRRPSSSSIAAYERMITTAEGPGQAEIVDLLEENLAVKISCVSSGSVSRRPPDFDPTALQAALRFGSWVVSRVRVVLRAPATEEGIEALVLRLELGDAPAAPLAGEDRSGHEPACNHRKWQQGGKDEEDPHLISRPRGRSEGTPGMSCPCR